MACTCDLNDGVREFPDILAFTTDINYKATIPRNTKCLGNKSVSLEDTRVNIVVLAESDIDMQLFAEFYITELEYGTKDFTIDLKVFGILRKWLVVCMNNLEESFAIGDAREIPLELKLLEDVQEVIQNTECTVCA